MKVCFTSRVATANLAAYRAAHAQVWPKMLEALRDTGWRDYRLYLGADGLLVGVVELEDSYQAAQARMALTEVNGRWQRAMAELFAAEGAPDEGMVQLDQIFHLEGQLAALGLPTAPADQSAG
ncbi:MAG: L-rhamnose mutarotase [Propionibacteriaceae bacterium]|jgi:L-rhamnose mutarotase|nr:L-rhamnose mutarotase [Propionibacteriaceae bacterium]